MVTYSLTVHDLLSALDELDVAQPSDKAPSAVQPADKESTK